MLCPGPSGAGCRFAPDAVDSVDAIDAIDAIVGVGIKVRVRIK